MLHEKWVFLRQDILLLLCLFLLLMYLLIDGLLVHVLDLVEEDECQDGLRNEGPHFGVQGEDFGELQVLGHAEAVGVLSEDLEIGLQGHPFLEFEVQIYQDLLI